MTCEWAQLAGNGYGKAGCWRSWRRNRIGGRGENKMLDMRFLRENPEAVKENIKKKFQEDKLPLVDQVVELDAKSRKAKQEADELRASRKRVSKEIGALMGQGKREEAEAKKAEVARNAERLAELEAQEKEYQEKVREIMLVIPNIIDPSVPIGKDDSENVEIEKFGEPVVPDYQIPYHAEIMESFDGLDIDAAEGWLEMASTISWEILPGFTPQ